MLPRSDVSTVVCSSTSDEVPSTVGTEYLFMKGQRTVCMLMWLSVRMSSCRRSKTTVDTVEKIS